MTNVECVTDLMEFSSYGPLAQMFVVDALLKHATSVAKFSDEDLQNWPENHLIHPIHGEVLRKKSKRNLSSTSTPTHLRK